MEQTTSELSVNLTTITGMLTVIRLLLIYPPHKKISSNRVVMIMKNFYRFTTGLVLTFGFLPVAAMANEPRLLGNFGDWQAYSRFDGQARICYALSLPKTKFPKDVRHGDIYFMVSSWKSKAAVEQPSFLAGFSLKTEKPPIIRVGNGRYPTYVSQNEGFIESNQDEARLIRSMKAGSTMRVEAVSVRNTVVAYSFSLRGVTAALQRVRQECN
jgi:hypothetical protein